MSLEFLKEKAAALEHLLLSNIQSVEHEEQLNTTLRQYVVELVHTHRPNQPIMYQKYIEAIEVQLELQQISYKTILPEFY